MALQDFASLEEFYEHIIKHSEGMAADIRGHADSYREKRDRAEDGICNELSQRWTKGFCSFEHLIYALEQNGLLMLKRSAEVRDEHSRVRDALMLLHASGTIIVKEIRTLLENGYWGGGAARWRAFHETAVTAYLVAQGGVDIAQRYMDHGFVVQTYRLSAYHEEHGRAPIPAEELRQRVAAADALVKRYDSDGSAAKFREQYGWAIPMMPKGKNGKSIRPAFDALERRAGFQERRRLVVTSHGLIHNDSAGVPTTVLLGDGAWSMGPVAQFTETVARPTFDSAIKFVMATHLGFEPELNDFAKFLGLAAAGAAEIASVGIREFASDGGDAADQ